MLTEQIQIDMTYWKKNIGNPYGLSFENRVKVMPIPESSQENMEKAFEKAYGKTGLAFEITKKSMIEIYDPKKRESISKNLYNEITLGNIRETKAKLLVRNEEIVDYMLLFEYKKNDKETRNYLSALAKFLEKPDSI